MTADLDVVLPVHNEAESIEAIVRELCAELGARLTIRLIICEDGSTDDTVAVLTRMQSAYPIDLRTSTARKGYSRAVVDGLRAVQAPYVLAIDSDGQCDPRDFWEFWSRRHDHDVVMGFRQPRKDSRFRRGLSVTFRTVFRLLFRITVRDPSCPYVLISRQAVTKIIPTLSLLQQGLWWEFTARAFHLRLRVAEVPVNHRARVAGATQVYRLRALPRIGASHLLGLLTVWRETRE